MRISLLRLLAIGVLALIPACGGKQSAPSPVEAQALEPDSVLAANLPSILELDAGKARRSSAHMFSVEGWTDAYETSGNAEDAGGGAILLNSAPGEMSYAIYGVQTTAYEKTVPFLAPDALTVVALDGSEYWLAYADYQRQAWDFLPQPISPSASVGYAEKLEAGLGTNGAREDGFFWFAIVAWDGADPTISEIQLHYPDIPAPGQSVDCHAFIPARDGVRLATDVYLPYTESNPAIPDPPYPVLLMRTPYDKANIPAWIAPTLTQANIAVVIQYFRGRLEDEPVGGWPATWPYSWPDSTGSEMMFTDHAGPFHQDAIDTVNWIEDRQWYNGELIVSGTSALASWIYQADTALGDRVAAAFTAYCAGNMAEWAFRENGCYKRSNVEGWIETNGYPGEFQDVLEANLNNEHYWSMWDFDDNAGGVTCPGYHETGWYDLNVNATIKSWRELQENGGPGAAGNQWLIIGPWAHDTPRGRNVGDYSFADDGSIHDPAVLPAGWDGSQWILDSIGRWPLPFTEPANRALVFVVGAPWTDSGWHNTWLELPTWPPPATEVTYYFDEPEPSGHGLREEVTADGIVTYETDPRFPLPTVGGANLPFPGVIESGPMIQDDVLELDGVLDFYNTDIGWSGQHVFAGVPRLVLFVSTDSADTDICVKLIRNDGVGRNFLICDTCVRLSTYLDEHGLGPVVPGTIYELEFELGNIAQAFDFTEEIHLAIQGTNYPRFDINPGNGDSIYTGTNGVVQTNTVFYGSTYPSRLIMPQYYPEL